MAGFAELMALSATHTRETESQVQLQLAERERRLARERKEREEQEKKMRAAEKQRLQRHFEEQKKEEERKRKKEEEEQRIERERKRREERERDVLRYGPKKAGGNGKESALMSKTRDDTKKRVSMLPEENPMALTREELRERKQKQLEKRMYMQTASPKRHSTGYKKSGRMLKGGALDITTTTSLADELKVPGARDPTQTLKSQLTNAPITLIKLNQVKRDTRTIDEIVTDRLKAKNGVLDGDAARSFDDWFGSSKKKTSATHSASASGTQTPAGPSAYPTPASSAKVATKSASAITGRKGPSPQPVSALKASSATSKPTSRATSADRVLSKPLTNGSGMKPAVMKASSSTMASSRPTTSALPKKEVAGKKRPRSRSPSPHYTSAKKQKAQSSSYKSRSRSHESDSDSDHDPLIQPGGIYAMLRGRSLQQEARRDVFSDDESLFDASDDMEAGADEVYREELRSAKIARKEDEEAEREEKRREEEKRKKKLAAAKRA